MLHYKPVLVCILLSLESAIGFSPVATPVRAKLALSMTQESNDNTRLSVTKALATVFASAAIGAATMSSFPIVANALESKVVGQIQGSGLVFKDTLQVEAFEDPKVRGVTLYVSNFQRPINERFSSAKNFFSDPSSASVACARTGSKVSVADNINTSAAGEEVFKESKSILFKSLRVQRIYDPDHNTVVYVSFNTRFDKNDDDNKSRFQNSLCAINLDNYAPEVPASKVAEKQGEPSVAKPIEKPAVTATP